MEMDRTSLNKHSDTDVILACYTICCVTVTLVSDGELILFQVASSSQR